MDQSGEPRDLSALFQQAVDAHVSGDNAAAEVMYRNLIDAGYPDSEAAYQLGTLLEDRGVFREAAEAYERALAQGDDAAELNLAILFADHLDRQAEAEDLFRAAVAKDFRPALPYFADFLYEAGRKKEAEAVYRQAIEAGSDDPDVGFQLGTLLEDRGEFKAAAEAYERAAALGDEGAFLNLAALFSDRFNRWPEAEKILRALAEKDNCDALIDLGGHLNQRGRADEAEVAYKRAIEAGCSDSEAAFQLGGLLEDREEFEAAAQVYDQAMKQGDRDADLRLASLYAEHLGRWEEAAALVQAALDRGHKAAFVNRGVMLAEQGQIGQAEAAFRQGVEAGEPRAHLHMGHLLVKRGRSDEALKEFREGLTKGADYYGKYVGWELLGMGRSEEAADAFRRGLEAGDWDNYGYLGDTLCELGRQDEAEKVFKEAIEKGRDDVLADYGALLLKRGCTDEAEVQLRRAVDLGDEDAVAALIGLYERTDRYSEAEELRGK